MSRSMPNRIERPVPIPHCSDGCFDLQWRWNPLRLGCRFPCLGHGFGRGIERTASDRAIPVEPAQHFEQVARYRHGDVASLHPTAEFALAIVAAEDLRLTIDFGQGASFRAGCGG